jgi:hypothetical protein
VSDSVVFRFALGVVEQDVPDFVLVELLISSSARIVPLVLTPEPIVLALPRLHPSSCGHKDLMSTAREKCFSPFVHRKIDQPKTIYTSIRLEKGEIRILIRLTLSRLAAARFD